ncbi:hypothetical protein CLAFUW4_11352 [Fulvia fulva]|uniref:Uncharacterized protein n=1 Tax=Passalora fulva TaxID=5499 RepID=A0A9Q8PDL3_PASFU|nr:uncharacterized protein CLAFUR5_10393 [Fulvia fulva]KAK4620067.1 hypothetical protein CLAFUR4_11358 [Fulvia fulva]KAK4620413.1 hypothetical protein CLAFUR0_11364 [Fulvia fulva]UJO20477.1 hypothetical protein CLAFUR5_10393 [Fulvia fulva]WPV16839.1 hypothetical protein CLAFUW4_11352 [Fulvia fulva]WPV32295.1 hypothetical protein CLAFUW7_11348 [Fulvia fulva]
MVLMPSNMWHNAQNPAVPYHQRHAMNDLDDLDIELGTYKSPDTVDQPLPAYNNDGTMAPSEKAAGHASAQQSLPPRPHAARLASPRPTYVPPQAARISSFTRRQQALPPRLRKAKTNWKIVACCAALGALASVAVATSYYGPSTAGTWLQYYKRDGARLYEAERISNTHGLFSHGSKRDVVPDFTLAADQHINDAGALLREGVPLLEELTTSTSENQKLPTILDVPFPKAIDPQMKWYTTHCVPALLYTTISHQKPEYNDSEDAEMCPVVTECLTKILSAKVHGADTKFSGDGICPLIEKKFGEKMHALERINPKLTAAIETSLPKILLLLGDGPPIALHADGNKMSNLQAFLTTLDQELPDSELKQKVFTTLNILVLYKSLSPSDFADQVLAEINSIDKSPEREHLRPHVTNEIVSMLEDVAEGKVGSELDAKKWVMENVAKVFGEVFQNFHLQVEGSIGPRDSADDEMAKLNELVEGLFVDDNGEGQITTGP